MRAILENAQKIINYKDFKLCTIWTSWAEIHHALLSQFSLLEEFLNFKLLVKDCCTEGCMGEQATLEFDLTFGDVLIQKFKTLVDLTC